MLADAAESASRTLVDPTPARIESLVESIAMKRLLDGQFDDCGITLQELRLIRESLVKLADRRLPCPCQVPGSADSVRSRRTTMIEIEITDRQTAARVDRRG